MNINNDYVFSDPLGTLRNFPFNTQVYTQKLQLWNGVTPQVSWVGRSTY